MLQYKDVTITPHFNVKGEQIMGDVIKFPLPRQPNSMSTATKLLTEREIIDRVQRLVWDNPRAFFTLQARCLSALPMGMPSEVKHELRELQLIDNRGRPLVEVKRIMLTITANISDSLAAIR